MNHLRELLDTTGWFVPQSIAGDHSKATREMVQNFGPSAICFWLGGLSDATGLQVIPELVRLPYEVCWFELGCDTGSEQSQFGTLAIQSKTVTRLVFFWRRQGSWRLLAEMTRHSLTAAEMYVWPQSAEAAKKAQILWNIVAGFLSALHCSNVNRQEHAPDAKLQQARAKRGKAPLFSYWTLQINGKSARGEHQGGTHSSPRVHLRRGHPRQYAPGLWTWVQPCAVGNRAAGMVHKDYTAGPALLVPAR